jgi:hypothetical protein
MCGATGTRVRNEEFVQNFVGSPEGNRSFTRTSRAWKNYVKISGSDYSLLPDTCEHGNKPSTSIKFGCIYFFVTYLTTVPAAQSTIY